MLFRKTILFLSTVVFALLAGCTTRYQDMLRERDERIRELSGDVARMRGLNEELERREQAALANATASPKREESGEASQLQNDVGDDASVKYRHGRLSIGINDSVTFDSGSTALKDSANRVLRNVASVLKNKYAGRRFYVEGHTDSDPIQKTKDKFRSNRHLSAERADAVARHLISLGVPEASIVIVGFGQYDPTAGKDKAQNRRVEIVIGDPIQ